MPKNVNERSQHQIDRGDHDEHCQSEKPEQPSGLPSRPLLLAKKIHAPVLTQTRISAECFLQQPTSGGADCFSSLSWNLLTPGGLTDRYLSDYSNLYGDLSAGSGLNALTRDEDHAREFIQRHQYKLIYGVIATIWLAPFQVARGRRPSPRSAAFHRVMRSSESCSMAMRRGCLESDSDAYTMHLLTRLASSLRRNHVLQFPRLEVAIHCLMDFGMPIGKPVGPVRSTI